MKVRVQSLSSRRLARAILYRAAKDLTKTKGMGWVLSAGCKTTCELADIDYGEYKDACRYISESSKAPRTLLLRNLKKHLA